MADPLDSYGDCISRMAAVAVALDERDAPTQGHCDRVSALSLEIARACALSTRELRLVRLAAGFHDVGKIGIPDEVLKKTTTFTDADWEIMKTHPVRSERIVLAAGLEDGGDIAAAVRQHHERYDGAGYPDGLAGESISIYARIVAIADTYDAMARMRPHGTARTHRQIMDELRREQGRQHDPYVFARFARLIERSRFKRD